MNEATPSAVQGIGIDIVEIVRIEKALACRRRFAERLFMPSEIEYCRSRPKPALHYAVRFAAKEAVAKALGTGFRGGVSWREIEITRDDNGRPGVMLHGATAGIASSLGCANIFLSVSFDHKYAIASAMATGEANR